jgi:hypothetical protein
MSTAYDTMCEQLNLDLDAHAGLLQVLGNLYGDIYLSQSGRMWNRSRRALKRLWK